MKPIGIILTILLFFTVSYSADTVKSKEFYLDVKKHPQRVFTGQKFDITLKATILKPKDLYDKIVLSYNKQENVEVLTKEPLWEEKRQNIFFTKLAFKAKNDEFKLPDITVALVKDEEIVDFLSISLPKIGFEKIAVNEELFSNVIAKQLQILTVKTKQYNNNTLLSTISIEGVNSNLEDIHLKSYGEQGIKSFEENYPLQNIYFYVMSPIHVKNIKFTYYNSESKDFVLVNVPVNLEEDLVSTQTDLNPYNSNLMLYKQSISIFFFVLFMLLFFITKKERYLVLITLSIVAVVYFFMPNKKTVLAKGTSVYILPTKNSTVYKSLNKRELVEIVNEKDEFKKVLFENQNTGWIKENDIK